MNIQSLIDEAILKQDEERPKKQQTSWHPSALGKCLCGVFLERIGAIPDTTIDERTRRVFKMGNLVEKFVVDEIKKIATIEEQVRIEIPEWDVTGYCDFVIETDDGREVIEVKSQHSRAFWYMSKQGEGAYKHHEDQLWLYLHALKIERGELIYVSKDDLCILQYPLHYDTPRIRERVLEKLEILNQAWITKVPPLPAETGTFQAKYCQFHTSCLTTI